MKECQLKSGASRENQTPVSSVRNCRNITILLRRETGAARKNRTFV